MIKRIPYYIYVAIFIIAFFNGPFRTHSQSFSGPGNQSFSKQFNKPGFDRPSFKGGNLNFTMQLGSSFTSMGRYGSVFSNYVSPGINYRVNSRLSVQTGMTVVNSFIDQDYTDHYFGYYQPYKGNITFARLYLRGQYRFNEKLTVGGTVYKDITMFDRPDPGNNTPGFDGKGFILDVNYRPTRNFQINAIIEHHEGYNPFMAPYYMNRGHFGTMRPW